MREIFYALIFRYKICIFLETNSFQDNSKFYWAERLFFGNLIFILQVLLIEKNINNDLGITIQIFCVVLNGIKAMLTISIHVSIDTFLSNENTYLL